MLKAIRRTIIGAVSSMGFALTAPGAAVAYPVDCAILLCLAGGWPASAECAHARAVFIRRITPWPIEPPLQIWRCPMSVSFQPVPSPRERLWSIASNQRGIPFNQNTSFDVYQTQSISDETGTSDIDISGNEFDFVRSIRVWNIMHYSHREHGREDDCEERYDIRLGTYGTQGEFSWQRAHPSQVPAWLGIDRRCRSGNYFRGVGVEWRDHEDTHGHEVVRY